MNKVTFKYQPPIGGDHTVGILGEFTNWAIVPMDNVQGIYQKDFWLVPGSYQYKFIVDGIWMHDPGNPVAVPDTFEGLNSVLVLNEEPALTDISLLPFYQDIPFKVEDDFPVPEWVKTGVVYQIFPDRFCNGNPDNNPDFSEWYYQDSRTPPPPGEYLKPNQEYFHLVEDWKDVSGLKQSPYLPTGKPDWWSFYGGDIAGVKQKLGYLKDLDVNILYFNPLWQSKSNHKYDAADFGKLDPHFGTESEFCEFVALAHQNGIRVILDIALNHTGETFWAFRDCVEKGVKSEYWNWYDWKKWPLPHPLPADFKPKEYYQCWWGIKDMPDLNYDLSREHPEENDITDINEAVPNWPMINHLRDTIKWWLVEMDIDGFRLDVPNEVPYWFWEIIRNDVKSIKPDAWLVGELWINPLGWVSDKYFDSVMNYAHFKDPVVDYFLKGCSDNVTLIQKLYYGLIGCPLSSCFAMMNLLGSHDTWRLMEVAQGNLDKLKLAILFQMTYIGAPHIFYGDEIGMRGSLDPDNRRTFDWEWEDDVNAVYLHYFYQELIWFRKSQPALQTGLIRFIYDKQLLIYERYLNAESVVVVINNTSENVIYTFPPQSLRLLYYIEGIELNIDKTTVLLKPGTAVAYLNCITC